MPTSIRWPFAAAAVVGVLVLGGAFYLIQRGQLAAGGPSPTPGVSSSPSQTASPSTGPSATPIPATAPSWTATGSMVSRFAGGSAVLLGNGKVLVLTGGTSAELYDPGTGTWTATGSMITPFAGGSALLLRNGNVLAVGGHTEAGGGLASAQSYDPGTGTWTATASMTTSRRGFSATLLSDGRVLVVGGEKDLKEGNPVEQASAELYDPGTGTWTATGSMLATRFGHTATLLPDGRVLVAGGGGLAKGATICCDPLPSAELYDPGTETWTATGNMTTAHVNDAATLLLDGKVLVAGGTAQLYDPGTGSWTATGTMLTTAPYFSATLLRDGKVLAAGGFDFSNNPSGFEGGGTELASAQLYDPGTGSWTATASMSTARSHFSATLLPDGRVLVAGGGADGTSAELYDPGSGQ